MPMKGRFPIRRTLQYLGQGDVVFKDSVKVMTVNYNTHGELGEGARKFVFFNIPQIQYKNPWVQIMMFKNMTPSPFLRFYLDSGEQVLVDVETKSNTEIMEHIRKILGKNKCSRTPSCPTTRARTVGLTADFLGDSVTHPEEYCNGHQYEKVKNSCY
ncbi:28S ribosomal protein S25, mitochondrial isoform X2 [Mirounga leonina]|uniref:28S ribosomal protein S25, mitochondrial isoform X2 n=1 Tax=Mirounga leonina TaxID=9715 RepID=UPI00156C0131|nr:28S ribosomal protein S25, mitochondrial isoform X2 [Mirounga leonina]